jgi:hypothetical protein
VAFAAPYPGKILPMDLRQLGGTLICQKDAFLCAARGVSLGIAFQQKLSVGFFGGEGFIMQKLDGDGLAFVHAGGTVVRRELQPGQTLLVDTGCVVAYTPSVVSRSSTSARSRRRLFGGEGLFFAKLTGPGTVWLQSLPFSRLASRVFAAAPQRGGRAKKARCWAASVAGACWAACSAATTNEPGRYKCRPAGGPELRARAQKAAGALYTGLRGLSWRDSEVSRPCLHPARPLLEPACVCACGAGLAHRGRFGTCCDPAAAPPIFVLNSLDADVSVVDPVSFTERQAHSRRQGAAPPLPVARREVADRGQCAGRFADLHRPATAEVQRTSCAASAIPTTCASRPT